MSNASSTSQLRPAGLSPLPRRLAVASWRCWAVVLTVLLTASPAAAQNFGGGPPLAPVGTCITPAERLRIETNVAQVVARLTADRRTLSTPPAPYPFLPIAGNIWDDRFVLNYVDLDPTTGIRDWDCTDWTYDGHQGHDIDLRSFGEQDAGVPVFAAMDGTVVGVHDGEYDRNTAAQGQPANHVILFHGGTHYTWYFHLRNGSVAVALNQTVKAGTQLGLAASSGNSTGPHLHFESRDGGTHFEPSAGNCRSGASGWMNQSPIRRDLWIEDFAVHNRNSFPAGTFLPHNPSRTGTIVRGAAQPIGAWYIIHNQPASSSWQVRYRRPDNTVFFTSPNNPYNNPNSYRYANWWFYYNLSPDVSGTWKMEVSVNGQEVFQAPFLVLDAGGTPSNRPPSAIATAVLEPAAPRPADVLFCRVTMPAVADPDYDLLRIRYRWTINGTLYREVTSAAHSDAIPSGAAAPGDRVQCLATPFDGVAYGNSTTIGLNVPGGHSADTGAEFGRIDLAELSRVIELYNVRRGTIRTGRYAVAAAATIDGFLPDAATPNNATVSLSRYHSADTSPRDGRLDLRELTRVVELYNTRTASVRTGAYHVQSGTEDGFAGGP